MESAVHAITNGRVNLSVPLALRRRGSELAKQNGMSLSEIVRRLLTQWIEETEAEKLKRELEEGYKANWSYYLKQSKEWEFADAE